MTGFFRSADEEIHNARNHNANYQQTGGYTDVYQCDCPLAIFFFGWCVAKIIRKMIIGVMERKNIDAMLVSFTSNIAYIALFTFVLTAALGKLGIQTTSFIAIPGAACLAIGLSLQGSLSNFASGIMIIFFRPF